MVVGVGLLLFKAQALSGVLHHRALVLVILGLGVVSSVLRTRLVGVAVTVGPLLAFALDPGSTAVGIAVGVGAFGLLLAMFFAVGTVLMGRENHASITRGPAQRPADLARHPLLTPEADVSSLSRRLILDLRRPRPCHRDGLAEADCLPDGRAGLHRGIAGRADCGVE